MFSDKMNAYLNEQIKWELYSGYLYLSMSAWLAAQGLPGAASWMRVQAQEELSHAMMFYDFALERGGAVELRQIDAPALEWESVMAVFEQSLAHEQGVTARIYNLMSQAHEDKDYATATFLQWFVTEQVEEEASVQEVLQKLKLIQGAQGAMFMLDAELGKRVFTPPTAAA